MRMNEHGFGRQNFRTCEPGFKNVISYIKATTRFDDLLINF